MKAGLLRLLLTVALLQVGWAASVTAQHSDDANVAADSEAPADTSVDASTYSVRLRDLERRIGELKEQIFRSKARLSLLSETVLEGVVNGALVKIVHESRMSESFRLIKIVYTLNGAPIFTRTNDEGLSEADPGVEAYNGSVVPGTHTLGVELEYRGNGYGVFSYLQGYRYKVRSRHTFHVPQGKATLIRVVAYEKGGPTAPLEERPAIRFEDRLATARVGEGEIVPEGTSHGGQ